MTGSCSGRGRACWDRPLHAPPPTTTTTLRWWLRQRERGRKIVGDGTNDAPQPHGYFEGQVLCTAPHFYDGGWTTECAHRKEALKRLTSCRRQKQQTDLVHQMFCQLHNPFNQCNKQLFQHLSLSPPGHNSSFLSAYWRPSICSFSLLPFFHHSIFFFPLQ